MAQLNVSVMYFDLVNIKLTLLFNGVNIIVHFVGEYYQYKLVEYFKSFKNMYFLDRYMSWLLIFFKVK